MVKVDSLCYLFILYGLSCREYDPGCRHGTKHSLTHSLTEFQILDLPSMLVVVEDAGSVGWRWGRAASHLWNCRPRGPL